MKKIDYRPGAVRLFLLLSLLVLLGVAFAFFRRGVLPDRVPALAVIAVFIAVMLVVPRIFFPAYKAIITASGVMGNLIFAAVAVGVFFLVLTPISLGMKLFGKRFLDPAPDPALDTYYDEATAGHDLEKQF